MGLWTAFKEAAKGNFSDAGNYLFIDEDAITTQKEVNNHQQALAAKQYQDGVVNEDEANLMFSQIQGNAFPYMWGERGPGAVFTEELKTGAAELPAKFASAINTTISGTSKFIGKAIPWWLWGILLIALLVYLSPFLKIGLKYVKRR